MNFIKKSEQGNKLLNGLIEKCWRDETFKNNLVNEPTTTIEKLFGNKFNLPENKLLMVDDQTNDSYVYLNIPARPDLNSIELNDEQLENVSGGDITAGGVATAVAIGLAATALYDFAGGFFDGFTSTIGNAME